MTNQEAIEILREKIFPCVTGDWKEAVGVAISALQEQEAKTQLSAKDICVPCKDAISRKAAIDYCYQLINVEHQQGSDEMNYGQERVNQTETILHHLELMPSAQPERCEDCEAFNKTRLLVPQPERKKGMYTKEELTIFAHGISLSLLSKRSAQHWHYDNDTAKEIEFLETLYKKVQADMREEST